MRANKDADDRRERGTQTFVVRLWTPAEPDDPERLLLRGVAEHVNGAERTAFSNAGSLVEFLTRCLARRRTCR